MTQTDPPLARIVAFGFSPDGETSMPLLHVLLNTGDIWVSSEEGWRLVPGPPPTLRPVSALERARMLREEIAEERDRLAARLERQRRNAAWLEEEERKPVGFDECD